jgi:hypothetical protein
LIGYGLISIEPTLDNLIHKLYSEILGTYWDKERHFIDEEYSTIPFPFKEINAPSFAIKLAWSFEHFIGYFNTWSALQHYIKKNNETPLSSEFISECKLAWGNDEMRNVKFPIYLKIGKI